MKYRRLKARRLLVTNRTAVYHVMSRIVRRQYWLEDEEKETFVRMLKKQVRFAGVELLSFCILNNHFHLLLRVPECPLGKEGQPHGITDAVLLERYDALYGGEYVPQSAWRSDELQWLLEHGDATEAEEARRMILARMGNLPVFVKELKQRFSIWFNHRHENKGTIWSAKFKSVLVEDCPLVLSKVAAYIDLNPVRAELVDDPADYRWSSFSEALAGGAVARRGLCSVFGDYSEKEYASIMRSYRLIIYGKGAGAKHGRAQSDKDRGKINPEVVQRVLEAKGEVPLHEALRCRIRYFQDGWALGGKEFIAQCFEEQRALLGPKRKRAGTPLPGSAWEGLHAFRQLKQSVFG